MWHDGWMSGWAWVWMTLVMITFWGLVAWVVLTLFRRSGRSGPDADAILDERLARGEIDEDEYHRRRRTLHA